MFSAQDHTEKKDKGKLECGKNSKIRNQSNLKFGTKKQIVHAIICWPAISAMYSV